jgi:hypothetical protein
MKKFITAFVLATTMAVAPVASAVETTAQAQSTTPLPPGGAAGVKQAQGFGNIPLEFWIAGGLILIVAIVLLAQNDDDNSSTPSTTTP